MAMRVVMARGWEKDVEGHVSEALTRVVDEAVADAKSLAPVDSGALRDSITGEVDGMEARIGASVEYAAAVELGTSRSPAQPYLRPAVLRERSLR